MMRVTPSELPDVLLIEPQVFGDARGYFLESWNQARYRDAGIAETFVQDNLSLSRRGALRGLHFQEPKAQGKLVMVLQGEVFDVAVDVRVGSPTFGKSMSRKLSEANKVQLYIPPGFAHGFCVLSDTALFMYKCTAFYAPDAEVGVIWNDPDLAVDWPVADPTLSNKDAVLKRLRDIDRSRLPIYRETQGRGDSVRR